MTPDVCWCGQCNKMLSEWTRQLHHRNTMKYGCLDLIWLTCIYTRSKSVVVPKGKELKYLIKTTYAWHSQWCNWPGVNWWPLDLHSNTFKLTTTPYREPILEDVDVCSQLSFIMICLVEWTANLNELHRDLVLIISLQGNIMIKNHSFWENILP